MHPQSSSSPSAPTRYLPPIVALAAAFLLVAATIITLAPRASAATLDPVSSFGTDPGALAMYEFAGGSIVAGVPVGCATSMVDAFTCMNPGKDRTPEQWGDEVRAKLPDGADLPRTAVWHGTSDTTVAPANGDASVAQWLNAGGVPTEPDATERLPGSTTASYYGGGPDDSAVAHYSVSGPGHGIPVDPGAGCGSAGAYFLDSVCGTWPSRPLSPRPRRATGSTPSTGADRKTRGGRAIGPPAPVHSPLALGGRARPPWCPSSSFLSLRSPRRRGPRPRAR